MEDQESYEKLRQLIDIIQKIDRNQLKRLQSILNQMPEKKTQSLPLEENSKDKDKQQLIGLLPYVLLDKRYFPTNDLLAMFAKNNLEINIKHYEKRSRNEILGIIIAEVVNKKPEQIKLFIQALNKIMGKEKKSTGDFFSEWDKIIRGV
jgi:hypothetical protein